MQRGTDSLRYLIFLSRFETGYEIGSCEAFLVGMENRLALSVFLQLGESSSPESSDCAWLSVCERACELRYGARISASARNQTFIGLTISFLGFAA